MPRDLHGRILHSLVNHGMTLTDLLLLHATQVLPVLQSATPVEVPGWKIDKRTKRPRRR